MTDAAQTLIVIPARMSATRLPGKPLAAIQGEPMIVHVWRRAVESGAGRVVVAAAEPEIVRAVEAAGGEAVLTDPAHGSGSDRIWEAVARLDPDAVSRYVINVQGDLPTLDPSLIRAALIPLGDPDVEIATPVAPIRDPGEITRPSVVKAAVAWRRVPVVAGMTGRALYFSRAPIPWSDPAEGGVHFHHIGLYAFRRQALARFVALPPSPLERREKLEQLRALEAGMRIDAIAVDTIPLGVDTPDDLAVARAMMARGWK